jgi:transposase-like protein
MGKLYNMRGVFLVAKEVHYPPEVKWKAVNMKLAGHSTREVMKDLGIKNDTQVETWMRWHRNGETHRFHQPMGKQYSYHKGIEELAEVERLRIRVRQLEMHNELLGKLNGILGKLQKSNS